MSLGLGDLKKKTRTAAASSQTTAAGSIASTDAAAAVTAAPLASKSAESTKSAKTSAPSQWTRSKTARPWSDELSTRQSVSASRTRKRDETSDVVINDDYTETSAAPLFWLDPASDSRLAAAQAKLVAIEEKVQRAISGPLQIIKAFMPGLMKPKN